MGWLDADNFCGDIGGELASIHSAEENEFIWSLTHNDSRSWIGLNDIENEGEWVWTDGSEVDFLFWHSDQPDNFYGYEHYVHLGLYGTSYWNDENQEESYYAICKRMSTLAPTSDPEASPSTETDHTIVLLGMSFKSSLIIIILFVLLIYTCFLLCGCAILRARERKSRSRQECVEILRQEGVELTTNCVQEGEI